MSDPTTSPEVQAFAELAERYVAFVDSVDGMTEQEVLRTAHLLLARLQAAALELPRATLGDAVSVGIEHSADVRERLGERLGEWRWYREVFDPRSDDEMVEGDLADDLADIRLDLVRGLAFWRRGLWADAVWEWRFGWKAHWGEHATSALRALYFISRDRASS